MYRCGWTILHIFGQLFGTTGGATTTATAAAGGGGSNMLPDIEYGYDAVQPLVR